MDSVFDHWNDGQKLGDAVRFNIQHENISFEIPNDWLRASHAVGFVPHSACFANSADSEWPVIIVPLTEVVAPIRDPGIHGLVEKRAIPIMSAIVNNRALPSLEADQPPSSSLYRIRNGYHRFYISVALGFTHLPLSVRPYFE